MCRMAAASPRSAVRCRTGIARDGGLQVFLGLIGRRESGAAASTSQAREPPRVAREATASLLALLEDDQTKLDVRLGCIPRRVRITEARAGPLLLLSA